MLLSKKPTKQRLAIAERASHPFGRRKQVMAHLSSSLSSRLGLRSLGVREGDTVKVVKGEHAGQSGRVRAVLPSLGRLEVVGITEKSTKGETVYPRISVSYVEITRLNLSDKWRKQIIKRKTGKEVSSEVVREVATTEQSPENAQPSETASAQGQETEGIKPSGEEVSKDGK